MDNPKTLNNIRTTFAGEVILLKRPSEFNVNTYNVSLSHEEYEYLKTHKVDRFEVLIPGRKSRRVQWDSKFLERAELRKGYYLVPYSTKSKLGSDKVRIKLSDVKEGA